MMAKLEKESSIETTIVGMIQKTFFKLQIIFSEYRVFKPSPALN